MHWVRLPGLRISKWRIYKVLTCDRGLTHLISHTHTHTSEKRTYEYTRTSESTHDVGLFHTCACMTYPQWIHPYIITVHGKYISLILEPQDTHYPARTYIYIQQQTHKLCLNLSHGRTCTHRDHEGWVLIAYHFQSFHSELVSKGGGGGCADRTEKEAIERERKRKNSRVRQLVVARRDEEIVKKIWQTAREVEKIFCSPVSRSTRKKEIEQ